MDPISIVGAVGAMANIIDVVAKSIKSLRELRDRWKEADLTLLTLAAQLTALRGALAKIRDWMEDLDGEPHHQLVMDLDVSVQCCQILMGKIDMLIGELSDNINEPLDFGSIVKLVFKGKSIEDIQRLMEQQTNALTLLLTACNCKALSEQKSLLEKSKTRKVIGRVQLDSASLYVNRDTASFVSRFTDNLSKVSLIFDFDSELFTSKIYQQVLRGSVKEALRRQQGARLRLKELKAISERSDAIDRDIKRQRLEKASECRVMLLGDNRGKATFLKTIKMSSRESDTDTLDCYTELELHQYRLLINKHVIVRVQRFLELIVRDHYALEHPMNSAYYDCILAYSALRDGGKPLSLGIAEKIYSTWKDPAVREFLKQNSDPVDINDYAPYFLDNIKRIAHPQYTPNSEDIFHAHALGFQDGVLETRIRLQKVNIRLVDIAGIQHNVRKYAHCLEGAAAIVFFYDLTSYDFMSEMAAFRETLDLFHLVLTNSDSLIRSSVILYLTNVAEFKEKLPLTPLGNIFPSYRDGADADEAMDYISGLFIQHPSCRDRGVHVRSLEDDDPQTLGLLEAAIANCVVRTAIEGFSDSSGNGPAK